MNRAVKLSPNIVRRPLPLQNLVDRVAMIEVERGSEKHPGNPTLQGKWDEYLDALYLANNSQDGRDAIIAARLYLAYSGVRDEQGGAL